MLSWNRIDRRAVSMSINLVIILVIGLVCAGVAIYLVVGAGGDISQASKCSGECVEKANECSGDGIIAKPDRECNGNKDKNFCCVQAWGSDDGDD